MGTHRLGAACCDRYDTFAALLFSMVQMSSSLTIVLIRHCDSGRTVCVVAACPVGVPGAAHPIAYCVLQQHGPDELRQRMWTLRVALSPATSG